MKISLFYFSGFDTTTLVLILAAIIIIIMVIIFFIFIAAYLIALFRPIKYPNQVPPPERHPKPYTHPTQNIQNQKSHLQAYYCQYCGQPIRFEERYQKWYCDSCGKYY